MSEWFKKADFYLRTAKCYFNKDSAQDYDYNIALACYLLSSSIEFNIKGLVEYYCGIIFEKSCGIHDILEILKDEKDSIKHYNKIESVILDIDNNAQEISSWNSEAVYNFDFTKSRMTVLKIVHIADDLNKFTSCILNNETENKSSISVSLYKMDLIGKTYEQKCEVVRRFMKEFYGINIPQKYGDTICNDIFWVNEHSEKDVKGFCCVWYMIGYTNAYIKNNPELEYYGGSFGFDSFEDLLDKIVEYKTLDEFMSHGAVYMRHA